MSTSSRPTRPTLPRRSAWPSQVPLPHGQGRMSDVDWMAFIERHLRSSDAMHPVDRALFDDARRSLLALRRYFYARAGQQCPRWRVACPGGQSDV